MSQLNPSHVAQPRTGNSTVILIALILAVVTVIMTNIFITMRDRSADKAAIRLMTATRELPAGHVLNTAKDLTEIRIPEQFKSFAEGAITPRDLPIQNGRKILRPLKQGDPLRLIHFQPDSEVADQKITEGKRGLPLPVNNRTATGLLRPGVYVDLVGSFVDAQKKGSLPRVMTIMDRVRVIAVGSETDETSSGKRISYSTITVEVDPADAETLVGMLGMLGKDGLNITLRNPSEQMSKFERINPEVRKMLGLD
jgi:Flp pilus assembly protein CpaB